MAELLMLIAVLVIMYKVADAEDFSPGLWMAITFVVCVGTAYVLPWPLTRIAVGGVASYAVMFVYKLVKPERAARRVL